MVLANAGVKDSKRLPTWIGELYFEFHSAVREALEKDGIAMAEADVTMIPQTYVELTDPQALKDLNRTLDLLDDDDDVQYVYTNLDE